MKTIDRLVKIFSGKFSYFNHNYSFFNKKEDSDKQILNKLLDPEAKLFSVIVYQKRDVNPKVFDNPKLFKKRIEVHSSILENKAWDSLNTGTPEFNQQINSILKLEYKLSEKSKNYWPTFDKVVKEKVIEAKKTLLPLVLEEHAYYYLLESKSKRLNELAKKIDKISYFDGDLDSEILQLFLDKNTKIKNKIVEDITKKKKSTVYSRTYKNQLPLNLSKVLSTSAHGWQQIYVYKKGKEIKVGVGSAAGSGTRESHGYFGHLFAQAQNQGKSIESFLVSFDQNLKPKIASASGLVLFGLELTGNYRIDKRTSDLIMKDIEMVFSEDLENL
jgi:hypothetical protein